MNFAGAGAPFHAADFTASCAALAIDPATLWTVLGVETHGFGFLPDRRPAILFERHIFHQRTGGRFDRSHPGLSSPTRGAYCGGASEYDRLAEAIGLAEGAALDSTSWGLGQIMGFNAKRCGYRTAAEMAAAFVGGEAAQLAAVHALLRQTPPLLAALRSQDWKRVAFFYNGAGYRANRYDARLAALHRAIGDGHIRPDFRVREAQAYMYYLRYLRAPPDGIDGHGTRLALSAFAAERRAPTPVQIDDVTIERLRAAAAPASPVVVA